MALDVYFREDILNVLRATYVASEGPAALAVELLQDGDLRGVPLEKLLQIYRRGFHTALAAVGLAFGLVPCEPVGQSLVRTQATPAPYGGQPETAEAPSAVEAGWHELDLIGFLWAKAQVEKRQR